MRILANGVRWLKRRYRFCIKRKIIIDRDELIERKVLRKVVNRKKRVKREKIRRKEK